MRYEFEAEIWRSDGAGGWFFVTLPADVAQGLRVLSGPKTGFGSIKVRRRANVTAGALVRIGVELTT
jgi:hypothetical protein